MRREGMEAVPRLPLDGEAAVEAVVDDVHARKGELGADLVRDARVDRHLQQRARLVAALRETEGTEVRHGVDQFLYRHCYY